MKIHLRKAGESMLVADGAEDAEMLSKIRFGEVIAAQVTRPRNYAFLKKYMALIKFAYDNSDNADEYSIDAFRKSVQMEAGYFEPVKSGKYTFKIPRSISFAEMSEQEFAKLYDRSIDVLLKRHATYDRETFEQCVAEEIARFAA